MALVSRQNLFPTLFTLVIHVVIVASLFWSWHVMPPTLPPPPPSIKAKLIKMNAVPAKMRPKPVDKKAPVANRNEPVEQPEPPKPEPKPEPKKQDEAKKQEEQKAISLAKKKEEEKKAEAEKKKQEDLKKAELEKKKQEEEKKKKAEDEKKKKEQEAKKKAEEQKKREAEARRKKEAQRKAELARQLSDEMADDEQYLDAQADQEAAMSYENLIQQVVEQNWSRPPSARNGMKVVLVIQLIPNGQVVDVSIASSSGNDAFDRSAVAAVKKAERFPELQQLPARVFDEHFRRFKMVFNPEDLRL
jgi:colicin import membrane protein